MLNHKIFMCNKCNSKMEREDENRILPTSRVLYFIVVITIIGKSQRENEIRAK
jgi:predicted metal-binding protein